MKIEKATYTVNNAELILSRPVVNGPNDAMATCGHVCISYDNENYEWDVDTDDTEEVWATAEEIHECIYGVKGTRGDVDGWYRVIMNFEV